MFLEKAVTYKRGIYMMSVPKTSQWYGLERLLWGFGNLTEKQLCRKSQNVEQCNYQKWKCRNVPRNWNSGVYKGPPRWSEQKDEVKGFAIIHVVQRGTIGYKVGQLQVQNITTWTITQTYLPSKPFPFVAQNISQWQNMLSGPTRSLWEHIDISKEPYLNKREMWNCWN
jgi:hypothetical protein